MKNVQAKELAQAANSFCSVLLAKTCESMIELKDKMAQLHGRQAIQLRLYVDYPTPVSNAQRQPSWQSLIVPED